MQFWVIHSHFGDSPCYHCACAETADCYQLPAKIPCHHGLRICALRFADRPHISGVWNFVAWKWIEVSSIPHTHTHDGRRLQWMMAAGFGERRRRSHRLASPRNDSMVDLIVAGDDHPPRHVNLPSRRRLIPRRRPPPAAQSGGRNWLPTDRAGGGRPDADVCVQAARVCPRARAIFGLYWWRRAPVSWLLGDNCGAKASRAHTQTRINGVDTGTGHCNRSAINLLEWQM